MRKKIFFNLLALFFGLGISYVLFEFFFALIGTSSKFSLIRPIECNTKKIPDINCFPRRKSNLEGRYIKGSLFQKRIIANKRTNDLGNFSDVNFETFKSYKGENILKIVSIGDSFIEAIQVDNNKTFHGLLNDSYIKKVGKNKIKIESIGFGSSGLAFPNYLKYIEFIKNKVKNDNLIFIITVIPNDFDESFKEYKNIKDGQFYFKDENNYEFIPLEDNITRQIKDFVLDNSFTARHLFFNLQVSRVVMQYPICRLWTKCNNPKNIKYASNIKDSSFKEDEIRYKKGYEATDIFIKKLIEIFDNNFKKNKLILIIDSDRFNIYDKKMAKSIYFENQRNYLIENLKKYNFTLLDTKTLFESDYKINKKRFEFINDGHWNSYAHQIIFQKLSEDIIPKIKFKY